MPITGVGSWRERLRGRGSGRGSESRGEGGGTIGVGTIFLYKTFPSQRGPWTALGRKEKSTQKRTLIHVGVEAYRSSGESETMKLNRRPEEVTFIYGAIVVEAATRSFNVINRSEKQTFQDASKLRKTEVLDNTTKEA